MATALGMIDTEHRMARGISVRSAEIESIIETTAGGPSTGKTEARVMIEIATTAKQILDTMLSRVDAKRIRAIADGTTEMGVMGTGTTGGEKTIGGTETVALTQTGDNDQVRKWQPFAHHARPSWCMQL